MQDDIYATFTKFEAYAKELAAKTLILKNDINYSEPEPYIDHSWEKDSSSQHKETLTQFIKMTKLNFEKINRHQETVQINMETSFENIEMQLGQVCSQLVSKLRSNGYLYENISNNNVRYSMKEEFKKKKKKESA